MDKQAEQAKGFSQRTKVDTGLSAPLVKCEFFGGGSGAVFVCFAFYF